jgi:hypothetical protein
MMKSGMQESPHWFFWFLEGSIVVCAVLTRIIQGQIWQIISVTKYLMHLTGEYSDNRRQDAIRIQKTKIKLSGKSELLIMEA